MYVIKEYVSSERQNLGRNSPKSAVGYITCQENIFLGKLSTSMKSCEYCSRDKNLNCYKGE